MKFTKNDQQLLAEAYTEVSLRELTIVEEKAIDKIQTALDIVGLEPTFGSVADGANSIISLLRAAASKETDKRKEHLINAGISAISLIPFADVIKLLKLRKVGKTATKAGVRGARALKNYSTSQKISNRFEGDI